MTRENKLNCVAWLLSLVMGFTEFCSAAYSIEELTESESAAMVVAGIYCILSTYAFGAYQGPVFIKAFTGANPPAANSLPINCSASVTETSSLLSTQVLSGRSRADSRSSQASHRSHVQAALVKNVAHSALISSEAAQQKMAQYPLGFGFKSYIFLGGIVVQLQWYFYLLSIMFEFAQSLFDKNYLSAMPNKLMLAGIAVGVHMLLPYTLYMFGDVAETLNDFAGSYFSCSKDDNRPHASYYLAQYLYPAFIRNWFKNEKFQTGFRVSSGLYLSLLGVVEGFALAAALSTWTPDFSQAATWGYLLGPAIATSIFFLIRWWQNFNFDSLNAVEGMRLAAGQPEISQESATGVMNKHKARGIFALLYLNFAWNMLDLVTTVYYYLLQKRGLSLPTSLLVALPAAFLGAAYLQLSEGYQSQKAYEGPAGLPKESANVIYGLDYACRGIAKSIRNGCATMFAAGSELCCPPLDRESQVLLP